MCNYLPPNPNLLTMMLSGLLEGIAAMERSAVLRRGADISRAVTSVRGAAYLQLRPGQHRLHLGNHPFLVSSADSSSLAAPPRPNPCCPSLAGDLWITRRRRSRAATTHRDVGAPQRQQRAEVGHAPLATLSLNERRNWLPRTCACRIVMQDDSLPGSLVQRSRMLPWPRGYTRHL